MTVARKNFLVIAGDGCAEATAGDCTPVSTLIDRAAGLKNVIMHVPGDFDATVKVYELGGVRLLHHNFRSSMKDDAAGAIELESYLAGYTHVMLLLSGVLAINLIGRCRLILRSDDWCI